MAERVVDLFEMIQVDEKERQSTLRCSGSNAIGVVGEEGSQRKLEVATVRETRQRVSHRLTPALLGKSAHPSHRQRQANTDRDQRRGGKSNGELVFFFQAEDGIRDLTVTGVQTCALPICASCAPRCPKQISHPTFSFVRGTAARS